MNGSRPIIIGSSGRIGLSTNGIFWDSLYTSDKWLSGRTHFTSTVFQGTLFLHGGHGASTHDYSPTSTSLDGINFVSDTVGSRTNRSDHAVVVFCSAIWLLGGNFGECTSPGCPITPSQSSIRTQGTGYWTNLSATGFSFPARAYHGGVVYKNRMFVIAGEDNATKYLNDIWYSEDSTTYSGYGVNSVINWTEAQSDIQFEPRSHVQCIVFQDKIYMIGGILKTNVYKDVWVGEISN